MRLYKDYKLLDLLQDLGNEIQLVSQFLKLIILLMHCNCDHENSSKQYRLLMLHCQKKNHILKEHP